MSEKRKPNDAGEGGSELLAYFKALEPSQGGCVCPHFSAQFSEETQVVLKNLLLVAKMILKLGDSTEKAQELVADAKTENITSQRYFKIS